jgi:hypothetical protein
VSATAAPNARRPPPHRRRGEPPGKPWSSYLSRALTPLASLHPVSPISLAFPKPQPTLHCRLSSPAPATHGIPVGSHHQAPSAPINPRPSFPVAHSYSLTPCCPPIAARASSPTSAVVAAFGPIVGSPTRASPHPHNSLASTTSSPQSSTTTSWSL